MFEGFGLESFQVGEVLIRARVGGSGPPLLLLHGNPQTHVMWHKVAPTLAEHFTVVAPDLRGYGMSSKPPSTPDHAAYSKRAMAIDQLGLMRQIGHERFFVAGHDRGGRVGYRLALDHPETVARLAVLDIIPTSEAFERGGREFGLTLYHWFFLAQPAPLPEKLIGSDPDWFWRWHTTRGPDSDFFDPDAVADYLACFRDPETIRGICEDYRAGATVDFDDDLVDKQEGTKIQCPVLVLWGEKSKPASWYDPLDVWSEWAGDLRGTGLPCGHYLPEEAPEQTAAELVSFFST